MSAVRGSRWTDEQLHDLIDARFDAFQREMNRRFDSLQKLMLQGFFALTSVMIAGFAAVFTQV